MTPGLQFAIRVFEPSFVRDILISASIETPQNLGLLKLLYFPIFAIMLVLYYSMPMSAFNLQDSLLCRWSVWSWNPHLAYRRHHARSFVFNNRSLITYRKDLFFVRGASGFSSENIYLLKHSCDLRETPPSSCVSRRLPEPVRLSLSCLLS